MTEPGYRVEHDSMGEVRVPAEALWGAQTQRAIENFPISGRPIHRSIIHALALVKAEAARVNVLDRAMKEAVVSAAEDVASGAYDDQFPIDVFQTGSGTSSNMNANEVIAALASARLGAPVHPNDQVNMSQSSNDVFPTAVHVAAALAITEQLVPAIGRLAKSLRKKQRAFAHEVKSGRTHLMDATPVTLGQEFGGYAAQVEDGAARLADTMPRLCSLPLGGTAVGTGINAPKGFARRVIARLAKRTDLPLTEAKDHFAAQGARDALVETSGQLRTLAVSLLKIANDVRWMASGPRTGLGEIRVPDLQPGSSIMPGKVNPVMAEVVTQVCTQVVGNDAAVAFGGSQGNFELNVFVPVLARNLLESIDLLAHACTVFADKCVDGIEANTATLERYAEASPAIATALNPYLGYEATASIIKEANRTGKSVRAIVRARRLMSAEQLDRVLDVEAMTRGGIIE
ncbi:MAG TPA: class II fumarate hydratase [Acidimicrobiia bacterium]|nr:class II fumarate hydratase [Acidimicrobiia bacterium]